MVAMKALSQGGLAPFALTSHGLLPSAKCLDSACTGDSLPALAGLQLLHICTTCTYVFGVVSVKKEQRRQCGELQL